MKPQNLENKLPDFQLMSTSDKIITNDYILGKKIIFFIYPKNDTSSCTKEAQSFSDSKQAFQDLGIEVFGVSKDTIASHKKFIAKHALNIELLSDESIEFLKKIGSWVEKSMYGKKYMGIDRTTFLISEHGEILKIWRKVKVSGHVQEVLTFAQQKFGFPN